MTVYVDRARHAYRHMKMCHMIADTVEELHAMADKIGLKRAWFQPVSYPHYDICQAKRALALRHGAVEVTDRRQQVAVMKACRERFRKGETLASLKRDLQKGGSG